MKKNSFLFSFFIFLSLSAFSFECHAETKKSAKEENLPTGICGAKGSYSKLKVAGFMNYPPFSWRVLDEEEFKKTGIKTYFYEGLIFDSVKEALSQGNMTELQNNFYENYIDIQKSMLRGQTDLNFTSVYVDDAVSGQDYIFPAYFGNPFIVVSRQSKKIDIQETSELSGLKGVVRKEEEIEPLIKGILPTDTKLEIVEGPEAAFKALLSGEADFMITSPYAADAESKRFKIKKELYFAPKVLRHIKYFASFSKRSSCRQYKDLFAKKFKPFFADKQMAEKRMQEQIQKWVDMHKDEPPLEYTKAQDE